MRCKPLNPDSLFSLLDSITYGAYAVSLDQRILFFNKAAERILGFQAGDVIGRRCYEVMQGTPAGSLTPECAEGCPSIRYLRAGLIPATNRLRMLCSSGDRKWVSVTPMVVSGVLRDSPMLVHLFDDNDDPEDFERTQISAREAMTSRGVNILSDYPQQPPPPSAEQSILSRRELEVLRLVALGTETPRIATELGISRHTVRNHIRNLRHKLGASTKLDAVVKGIRLGLLTMGPATE
jgi:PAS domain S-box-containing protein